MTVMVYVRLSILCRGGNRQPMVVEKDLFNKSVWLGNYYGFKGQSFDGGVYDKSAICPTLRASMCNGSVPHIIDEDKQR